MAIECLALKALGGHCGRCDVRWNASARENELAELLAELPDAVIVLDR